MIEQIFVIANRSYRMFWCKKENLILNIAADKVVNADKRQDTAANKKLNTAADQAINADQGQDTVAGKELNARVKPSVLVKDQITR